MCSDRSLQKGVRVWNRGCDVSELLTVRKLEVERKAVELLLAVCIGQWLESQGLVLEPSHRVIIIIVALLTLDSMLSGQAVAYIAERGDLPLGEFELLRREALVVDLLEAGQRLGLLTIQGLLLVHVEDAEAVTSGWEFTSGIWFTRDFEEEPVAVAFSICVWADV